MHPHAVCKTEADISRWISQVVETIRTETWRSNKASIAMVASALTECFRVDDNGDMRAEVTKRHIALLTGISPTSVWKTLKELERSGMIFCAHSAYMRSRRESSVFFPLLPGGTNTTSSSSTNLLLSTPPYALHSQSAKTNWSQRESAQVRDLCDPRHNAWHRHREAWLIYRVVCDVNWGQDTEMSQIRQATGLSYNCVRRELEYLLAEGILEWVDDQGPWEKRLVKAKIVTEKQVKAMHVVGVDHLARLQQRIAIERKLHKIWIELGCITRMRRSPQWKRTQQMFDQARLRAVTP